MFTVTYETLTANYTNIKLVWTPKGKPKDRPKFAPYETLTANMTSK